MFHGDPRVIASCQVAFESCEVVGSDELGLSTQQALLEHARLRDEHKR